MDAYESKTRASNVVANLLKEKVQNLPLLCVESICKFTPTSKLIRVYSNAVPLTGAFWSFALEAALKQRLPLSLGPAADDFAVGSQIAVFDAAGADVGCVKHPEAFRFSAVLPFIESATLTVHATSQGTCLGQLCVRQGETVISQLSNVSALSLVVHDDYSQFEDGDLLQSIMKNLLPQLESLVIRRARGSHCDQVDRFLERFLHGIHVHEMPRLRRLDLPYTTFQFAMRQADSDNRAVQPVLSGLSSLGIWQSTGLCYVSEREAMRADMRRVVSTCFRHVSALHIIVCGEFKAYLDAFRVLTGLFTLGLNLDYYISFDGLTFDGSGAIGTVVDLRIKELPDACGGVRIFRIAPFFPNVKEIALQASYNPDPLELATRLFGKTELMPTCAKLACLLPDKTTSCRMTLVMLKQFLANPYLPEAVDLSQIIFENLAHDADSLATVYSAMAGNSSKSLQLRGPLHREALLRLQSHVELNGEKAKISAWKDRDLGDQPGILNLTEISEKTRTLKILGMKTSGSLKSEQFAIRVFHQLAKRVDIFDSS